MNGRHHQRSSSAAPPAPAPRSSGSGSPRRSSGAEQQPRSSNDAHRHRHHTPGANPRATARNGIGARQQEWLRIRADSVGSVRGAFGTLPANANGGMGIGEAVADNNNNHGHAGPRRQPPPTVNNSGKEGCIPSVLTVTSPPRQDANNTGHVSSQQPATTQGRKKRSSSNSHSNSNHNSSSNQARRSAAYQSQSLTSSNGYGSPDNQGNSAVSFGLASPPDVHGTSSARSSAQNDSMMYSADADFASSEAIMDGGSRNDAISAAAQRHNLESAARVGFRNGGHHHNHHHRRRSSQPRPQLSPQSEARRRQEINMFSAIATSGGAGGGAGGAGVGGGGYGSTADAAAGGPMVFGGADNVGRGGQHPLRSNYQAVNIEQGGSWHDTTATNGQARNGGTSGNGGSGGITGLFTGLMDKITGHSDDVDSRDDDNSMSIDDDDVYDNVSEDTEERIYATNGHKGVYNPTNVAGAAGPSDENLFLNGGAGGGGPNDDDDDRSTLYGDEMRRDATHHWFWKTWYRCVYDPHNPEFSSTQQFTWACLLGGFFGVFTAVWGMIIEGCVEVVWVDVPERLLEWGVFTELEGHLPLPHYMWICPAVLGGILAWITVKLPKTIPDQNEWIETIHRVGVLRHDTFFSIIFTATGGMASGLSLGPELPLVLSSGMVGSYLALKTHQSILSARVLNLTAGSAAIAGFFGFPMAGAMFVLELPHQMGLQYFEAISPSTIASIVAVLVNRMVTGNEIKGYFNYPWLADSLPSHLFYIAVIYGLYGAAIGVAYAEGVKKLKTWTHDWFHHHEDHHGHAGGSSGITADPTHPLHAGGGGGEESKGLLSGKTKAQSKKNKKKDSGLASFCKKISSLGIKDEATRAAVIGVLAGALTGIICMFVPHNLFWGEAQLQTLIDKGKTPLPFFGEGEEPTAIMTAYGFCMVDPENEYSAASGFGIGCAALIAISKTVTIGLSIGTGIIGGHFWGPLFVGCAAGHFFTDLMIYVNEWIGLGFEALATYPCVAILCIMGSTHIVTFRAHLAIMLILTLTINTFEGGGDYSAVFPLLVVSCFVSLMLTRGHIFYKQQRCRGDIIASPEVLCEPYKEGTPEYPQHEMNYESEGSWYDDASSSYGDGTGTNSASIESVRHRTLPSETSAEDIEREFMEMTQKMSGSISAGDSRDRGDSRERGRTGSVVSVASHQSGIPKPMMTSPNLTDTSRSAQSKRIDEILSRPLEANRPSPLRAHRRVQSTGDAFDVPEDEDSDEARARTLSMANAKTPPRSHKRTSSMDVNPHRRVSSMGPLPAAGAHRRSGSIDRGARRERSDSQGSSSRSGTPTAGVLMRVNSYGEVSDFQPSLMNQARARASSVTRVARPGPSGRHSRSSSNASANMAAMARQSMNEAAGALTQDDLEREFSNAIHSMNQNRR